MTREVRNENKGAGVYGTPAPSHKTACPNSNNPAGHNPACPCGWNKSIPASLEPAGVDDFPPSKYGWWADE